ncbi:phenylacetate--CoA ligase family protein [Pseudoalteromonas sp. OANN1]|uniref:phenylacetate--CoA ligase family protein n=1 Tax=Pseudoalteromonas sp. OANN1 TaxID=2954497 RepID=UPI0020968B7D|nr:phenylacetate--CoA ligase family protein [Pseudoalteromonas sp. OANN1]MCO7199089.1 phenylacetate--CoA ligase family protein [Pseudoalteromonas sp. OANN1]
MDNLQNVIKEIRYAYGNVQHYKRKLDEIGVTPQTIETADDVSALPFTYKVDYRKSFPIGVLAKGFTLNHPMLTKSNSSGTAGERLTTVEIGMLLLQRAMSCSKSHPAVGNAFHRQGRKICRYAAPNCSDVECANPNSALEDRLLPDKTLVLPVYHDLMTTSQKMIDQAINEVLEYQPDLFYVDPTHFSFLIRNFKKQGKTLPDIPVVTSYSAANLVTRRQITEHFSSQTHFAELLSSSEMGWIGMSCPAGHLHLNDDSFYFEFINQHGHPAAVGENAELCISSIDQGACPHIRYMTGDMVRYYQGTCECGSDRTRINMLGRATHFITQQHKPVMSPWEFDQIIQAPDWLDVYQLEQIDNDEFVLRMIVNDGYSSGAEKPIIEAFKQQLGRNIDVNVMLLDYIPAERSGKFQAVKGGYNNVSN